MKITEMSYSGCWEKLIRAIGHAKDVGLIVRLNCTVCSVNYKNLDKLALRIKEIKPLGMNFIPLNYWDGAEGSGVDTPYHEMAPHIKYAIDIIKEVGEEYGDITGRRYGLIEKYRTDGAEQLLITSGAISETAKDAIDILRKRKKKTGLVRIRTFRPFPKDDLKKIMKNAEVVGVIDRNISLGNEGIFFQEI